MLTATAKGDVLAIDAEFVSNREEITETQTDGTQFVIKPGEFALARVSVLRPLGAPIQEPFMDDYIAAVEPVVDYVTRFSGIRPGDLDPAKSTHHLVSLKVRHRRRHTRTRHKYTYTHSKTDNAKHRRQLIAP